MALTPTATVSLPVALERVPSATAFCPVALVLPPSATADVPVALALAPTAVALPPALAAVAVAYVPVLIATYGLLAVAAAEIAAFSWLTLTASVPAVPVASPVIRWFVMLTLLSKSAGPLTWTPFWPYRTRCPSVLPITDAVGVRPAAPFVPALLARMKDGACP
ncbi:hypothetical protein WS58_00955 [Burkholderia pseudomultivorans]|nr:hypothetical protein WS57_11970 [Burkholderia pseudomultivorans]KVC27013.1 hypothetical protein WS56_24660 [Burkholderia pseudomultivorans]KVC28056.1 hypothetical protein WS55_11530 [Burkholderia pseudomultivorans]KVC41040.1 hypothetical protein WS58_00955 [Burkholderia pseudomultivorans]